MKLTTPRNPSRALTLAFLCIIFIFLKSAYAGQTVITTSDNAPTYGNASEVVISPTKIVTLKTTWTNGSTTLGMPPYTVTPSGGLVMMNTYPKITSKSETAMFSVASAGIGQVNKINVNITHTGSGASGPCPTGPGNTPTFTVCVPQITAGFASSNAPPFAAFCGASYFIHINIVGCDDFSQIQFKQEMNTVTNQTSYTGTVAPYSYPPDNISDNSGGWKGDYRAGDFHQVNTKPGGPVTWHISGNTAYAVDHHKTGESVCNTIIIGAGFFSKGTTYDYAEIFSHTAEFQDNICRYADNKPLYFDFKWCDGWDNKNATGTSSTQPTLAQVQSQNPTYTIFAAGGAVPATGGTGSNTGEFIYPSGYPNTLNPPLPTAHTP